MKLHGLGNVFFFFFLMIQSKKTKVNERKCLYNYNIHVLVRQYISVPLLLSLFLTHPLLIYVTMIIIIQHYSCSSYPIIYLVRQSCLYTNSGAICCLGIKDDESNLTLKNKTEMQ